MSQKKATKRTSRLWIQILALAFSIIPPALAVLFYFPLWERTSAEKLISGGTLLLLIFAAVPLFKLLAARIKTPAAYVLWLIIFLLFYLLSSIAREMIVISFTGFCGNVIGAVLFGIARRGKSEE